MLTLTKPDQGILDELMNIFHADSQTARGNNSGRALFVLIDDHPKYCLCQVSDKALEGKDGMYWYSKWNVIGYDRTGAVIPLEPGLRPNSIYSHP